MESPCPKPEKSDMKATNNLIQKLMTLTKEKPSTSKSPKTPPNRKRPLKLEGQYSKITSWLNRENESKRKRSDKTQIEARMKPLDIVIKTDKSSGSKSMTDQVGSFEEKKENVSKLAKAVAKKSKAKSSKSLKRNSSFEKYGIAMPSFEKIKADQKEFEIHRENVKKLDIFDENILHKSLVTDCLVVKEFTGELLDCKHLSFQELEEAFKRHLHTMGDIFEGKKYSERHALFHKQNREVSLSKDLRCSASLVVFTQDQKDYLLDMMRNEFDPEDKLTSYFFKVLLPELCLLIFMDEHKMSKRKAGAYLDKRPVD